MSQNFTYSGNPDQSALDQVRFLVGDTSYKDPLLFDGEIKYLLGIYNNTPLNAAIRACETIISKLSRKADETVGRVSIQFSQQAKGYRETLTMLKVRLATEAAIPYAGGLSKTDKQINNLNADRVRPDFTKHMMENLQIAPWVTQSEMDFFLQLES